MPLWRKLINGCGCIFLLGLLGLIVASQRVIRQISNQTPEDVAKISAQIAPLAHVPSGFVITDATDLFGRRSVSFENKEKSQSLHLFETSQDIRVSPPSASNVVAYLDQYVPALQKANQFQRCLKSETLQAGKYTCLRRLVDDNARGLIVSYLTIAFNPTNPGRLILVSGEAKGKNTKDEFFISFVTSLGMKPWQQ